MRTPRKFSPKRKAVAGLTTGVVISMTALTAGLAPAVADPRPDPVVPTTPVVVVPEQEAPVVEAPQEASKPAPVKVPEVPQTPVVPQSPVVPQVPAAPPVAAPAPAPELVAPAPRVLEAPTPAPEPQVEAPKPAPRSAPKSAPPSTADAPTTVAVLPSTEKPAPSSTEKPAPSDVPSSPVERKPVTSTTQSPTVDASSAPTTVSSAPATPGGATPESPAFAPPSTGDPSQPSSPAGDAPTSAAPKSAEPEGEPSSSANSVPSASVSAAARAIKTEKPQTLEAPKEDVQVALSAQVVEEKPLPAPKDDVAAFASALKISDRTRDDNDGKHGNGPRDKDDVFLQGNNRDGHDGRDWDHDWDHKVKQWDPDWVQYDDYYRPVICNPYRQPVKIVYVYMNQPRIVIINPLQRVVLEVAQYAAYSFTAVVANAVNQAVNVAVGSFFGGGYYPGFGLPLPPPPPPVLRYDNVPVQVRYSQAVYEPFRVQRIVDVGLDAQYGEHKVLLDGVTPAWGTWTQSPTGERQFEIHKTQQFPGLEQPAEGQLPGDYQLRLASDNAPSGMDAKTIYMVVAAGVLAALSLGAVLWSAMLGRRKGTPS